MKARENIDTSYLFSIFLEPHFKNIADEYVKKTPMNGSTVPLQKRKTQKHIDEQLVHWVRTFYFPEEQTERDITYEISYLIQKVLHK